MGGNIMAGLSWCERRMRVRGAKLAGQVNLTLPIDDHPLELANLAIIWNSDNSYSSAKKNRVTVPAGFAGVYSVHAVVHWKIGDLYRFLPEVRDGNYFITQLAKNGSASGDLREARAVDAPTIPAKITRQDVFWEAELEANSYIEVLVSCEVRDQAIMDLYDDLFGSTWRYRLEHWLTVRRLGKLV